MAALLVLAVDSPAHAHGGFFPRFRAQRSFVKVQQVQVQKVYAPPIRVQHVQKIVAPVYAAPIRVQPIYAAPIQKVYVPQPVIAPQVQYNVAPQCQTGCNQYFAAQQYNVAPQVQYNVAPQIGYQSGCQAFFGY